MKLWDSFLKELKLASRGFYFYVEILLAVIILVVLLFIVPEEFDSKTTEYLYYDMSQEAYEALMEPEFFEIDLDGKAEIVEFESKGETYSAKYYESDDKKIYVMGSREEVIKLAENEQEIGAAMTFDETTFKMYYEYYIQGYETQRLKNIYLVLHNNDWDTLKEIKNNRDIRSLGTYDQLGDRENTLPVILVFNGSLMGLFIIAAYIFLDKHEGVIKAYAVTASSVWQYLMSKAGVILVTSILSTLLVVIPIMGTQPNYLLLLVLLLTSGFFASALGLLIASFYDHLMKAFGAIFIVMILFMLPSISYFMPSWEPTWLKIFPTYSLIQGFKEVLIQNGDARYVLLSSLAYLVVGVVLFLLANKRFKKTLTV